MHTYACYKYLQIAAVGKAKPGCSHPFNPAAGCSAPGAANTALCCTRARRAAPRQHPPLHQDGVLLQRARGRGRSYLLHKAEPKGFPAARMPRAENRDSPGEFSEQSQKHQLYGRRCGAFGSIHFRRCHWDRRRGSATPTVRHQQQKKNSSLRKLTHTWFKLHQHQL